MKNAFSRARALLLALFLTLSLAPAALAAEGEVNAAAITAAPQSDGHLRFGEAGDLTSLAASGVSLSLGTDSLADAIAKVCETATGFPLSYISYISVSARQGTLYDGYNSEGDTGAGVAGARRYYYGDTNANDRIQDIRFVPKTDFTGRATITYYGYYTYTETSESGTTTGQRSYIGQINITVSKQEPGISFSTDGEAVQLSEEQFAAYASAVSGRTFNYITFTLPPAAQGSLYYNYRDEAIYDAAVTADARYYRSRSPYLDDVYFVPAKGFSGSVTIAFNGVDSAGNPFDGTVNITVTDFGPGHTVGETGAFTYSVAPGESVSISKLSDFTQLCRETLGGSYVFERIRFMSLPTVSEGVLYYGGGTAATVRTATDYYADLYPALTGIRFQAHYSFTGTVEVPFRGYGAYNGNTRYFDGTLRFVVASDGGGSPLHYPVDPGKTVYFEESDFTTAAAMEMNGYPFIRVRFNALPPSSAGTMYYLNGNNVSRVTAHADYLRGNLSALHFIASDSFTGSVTIPFTGYGYTASSSTSNPHSFNGTVTITSTRTEPEPTAPIGGTASTLTYSTTGRAVALNAQGILNAASPALPGTPATVRLTAPADECGRLCVNFSSPASYSAFNARQSYPVSEFSRISFLPKAGYSGTVRLDYTVADAKGNSYTGNLSINVTPPSYSSYFSDLDGSSWAVPAVDFLYSYGVVRGTAGRTFSPGAAMKRGDFVLMLSRTFSFPNAGVVSYSDVPAGSYYAAAIAGARAAGVVTGSGKFDPQGAITREDAATMLYRCLNLNGSVPAGTAADLASFSDRGSVSSGAAGALGALARLGVFQGANGRLNPKSSLTRAEMAAILYRALA